MPAVPTKHCRSTRRLTSPQRSRKPLQDSARVPTSREYAIWIRENNNCPTTYLGFILLVSFVFIFEHETLKAKLSPTHGYLGCTLLVSIEFIVSCAGADFSSKKYIVSCARADFSSCVYFLHAFGIDASRNLRFHHETLEDFAIT